MSADAPRDSKRYVLVYSDRYVAEIGPHVFPVAKYAMVVDELIHLCGVKREEFLEPKPPTRDQLALVHTREYLNDFLSLRWTPRTAGSEMPLTREIADAYVLSAGGTLLAAREAIRRRGFGIHIGGGFHHTFPDHAEGFCYINDIAVAIRVLQHEGVVRRAAVVDCDVHQGNGTARIFQDDPDVFTFSIHQHHNYPPKEKSDLDIGLRNGVGDEEYLAALAGAIPARLEAHRPELVIYNAGADPYEHDLLGGLALTKQGLTRRDELVIGWCAAHSIPIVSLLAGGYAADTNDTVDIHVNTCRTMIEVARRVEQEEKAGSQG
ncbi:MAG: histone deacetylase [Candidatus Sumerlaeia bacterium]|nr:histone deacetylase [Candidatus Sumerlaeia bacterium]